MQGTWASRNKSWLLVNGHTKVESKACGIAKAKMLGRRRRFGRKYGNRDEGHNTHLQPVQLNILIGLRERGKHEVVRVLKV